MNKILILTIFTLFFFGLTHGMTKNPNLTAEASRVEVPPKIDGLLDDDCWDQAQLITGLSQWDPDYGSPATQKSLVYIVFDNEAVYVGAKLLDSAPDSILRQLGNRDDGGLNADWFGVQFDTYFNQLDAYTFRVYASGVQMDRTANDRTYDAVWQSKVQLLDDGWSVEMKIPYSAIRFPKQVEQIWGLQVQRYIRRNRENDMWALGVRGVPNQMVYWGTLYGIKDVKPPIRLSLTPYFSIAGQHDQNIEDKNSQYSYSFGGGADLKFGINESYTLDMTLFPDFSQVKSDDKVKNLSAFEVVYDEQRPFFKEAVDLFKKGGLFYSRRIGGTPAEFYDVPDIIDSTSVILDNPSQAKLLNATKISGRGKNGLAIGFLNAITNNTYAEVEDAEGNQSKILTDPFTNYNITVLDQALKNNSSAYIINTSVLRSKKYDDANVTGAGINLLNRQNTYSLNASGAFSQVFEYDEEIEKHKPKTGYQYAVSAGKVSGDFQYTAYRSVKNDTYDDNDLGITRRNDFVDNGLNLSYYIFDPFWIIRHFNSYVQLSRETNFTTQKNINTNIRLGARVTYLNYLSTWFNMNYSLFDRYDYYDPREEGRFIIRPGYYNTSVGFSTDYRQALAFDGNIWFGFDPDGYFGRTFSLSPRVRVNDKLFFDYTLRLNFTDNFKGYVTLDDSSQNIIYGNRITESFENSLSGRYMFKNNLSISLWMRHYWFKGTYSDYYTLNEQGNLDANDYYNDNNDFNFNTFNLDLVFNWEFAPGSNLSIVWKNAIVQDDNLIVDDFLGNFKQTMQADQLNQISFKLLYYLDYFSVFKGKG